MQGGRSEFTIKAGRATIRKARLNLSLYELSIKSSNLRQKPHTVRLKRKKGNCNAFKLASGQPHAVRALRR